MRSGSELLSEKMRSRCAFSQRHTDSQKLPASHRHPNALFTLCLLGIWITALFPPLLGQQLFVCFSAVGIRGLEDGFPVHRQYFQVGCPNNKGCRA